MGLWGSLLLFLPVKWNTLSTRCVVWRCWAQSLARQLKPAVYRSGNAHSITNNHANVGEMKMAAFRRQLVVRVVKTENFAGLRDEIVNIMQGDAAEADF